MQFRLARPEADDLAVEPIPRRASFTRADLDTLLASSDVISIHLPLTPSTRGMIGAQQIARMKDGVILINTARAPIICPTS